MSEIGPKTLATRIVPVDVHGDFGEKPKVKRMERHVIHEPRTRKEVKHRPLPSDHPHKVVMPSLGKGHETSRPRSGEKPARS